MSRKRVRTTLVVAALAVGIVVAVPGIALASGRVSTTSRSPAGGPVEALAILIRSQAAHVRPEQRSAVDQFVQGHRPLTGVQTVLPVVASRTANGTKWLDVELPGRPNGGTGWILRRDTIASWTSWRIVVDLARRTMTIDRFGRPQLSVPVVVGKPSTPTPRGNFFVEEVVALPPNAVGAPYAFALSARSNVFQEFEGGPGQIALHGLENVGGVPGTAVSHGCVRLNSVTLNWMRTRIGPGIPVTIVN